MGIFITEGIISESGLTGNILYTNTLYGNTISATTFYGSGLGITNFINVIQPSNPNNSILYQNNNVLTGSSNFIYSGDTLFFTGTSKFNGQFYVNGTSPELKVQWFGAITAGATPGIIWTNMPAGNTTWLHQTSGTLTNDATYLIDLTEYSQSRFYFSVQVGGQNTSVLTVQWSTDAVNWQVTPLATVGLTNTTGAKDTGWVDLPSGSLGLIYIRLIGSGGNGVADPRISPPIISFR